MTGSEQASKIIGLLNRVRVLEKALDNVVRQLDEHDGIDARLRVLESRVFAAEREPIEDQAARYLRDVPTKGLPRA